MSVTKSQPGRAVLAVVCIAVGVGGLCWLIFNPTPRSRPEPPPRPTRTTGETGERIGREAGEFGRGVVRGVRTTGK